MKDVEILESGRSTKPKEKWEVENCKTGSLEETGRSEELEIVENWKNWRTGRSGKLED